MPRRVYRHKKPRPPEPAEPDPVESTHGFNTLDPGSMYTAEEVAWLKAVEQEQRRIGTKFLSHVDYLRLAKSLGYTRDDDGDDTKPKPTGRG